MSVCGVLSAFWRGEVLGRWGAMAGNLALIIALLWFFGKFERTAGYAELPVLMISVIGLAAAWHAKGYLATATRWQLKVFWLFFDLMLASMLCVSVVEHPVVFLICWELMGLTSYVLVAFEHHEDSVLEASWIYILACESGGLLLMLAMAMQGGSWEAASPYLYLAGFGLKAGFPLLHFWLPAAHPAAPAPVSAVMSAAMIPLGFIGFLRLANPGLVESLPCGVLFTVLGIVGAFFGILSAMACSNLKRLLAYSSVENMGIVAMGFGLYSLGVNLHNDRMMICGMAGALLHILNHALLKGSLFLAAGSVLRSTGTLDMDRMGGLMKKMPITGTCFTLSSLGICGLPPFCGFCGEALIYVAAFSGMASDHGWVKALCLTTAIMLALTGAVACAAFAKSISAVFLGEPRHEEASEATKESKGMVIPIVFLNALALLMPVLGAVLFKAMECESILWQYAKLCGVFYLLAAVLLFLRWRRGTDSRRELGTWGCGYAKPTARMQYTGTAFVQPLADLFQPFLKRVRTRKLPDGYFPTAALVAESFEDFSIRVVYGPIVRAIRWLAIQVHRLQTGSIHFYIFIMVLTLVVLLICGFGAEILRGGN